MNIVIGERRSGKTTRLIKESAATGAYIITINHEAARFIMDTASRMGLEIPHPISIRQYMSAKNANYHILSPSLAEAMEVIRNNGVLIDDADIVLQTIFKGIDIHEICINVHDYNKAFYLQDIRKEYDGPNEIVEDKEE